MAGCWKHCGGRGRRTSRTSRAETAAWLRRRAGTWVMRGRTMLWVRAVQRCRGSEASERVGCVKVSRRPVRTLDGTHVHGRRLIRESHPQRPTTTSKSGVLFVFEKEVPPLLRSHKEAPAIPGTKAPLLTTTRDMNSRHDAMHCNILVHMIANKHTQHVRKAHRKQSSNAPTKAL